MSSDKRIQRLNALIKNEVGQILLREFDFSDAALLTLTRVETANNLNQAKIYVSIMPEHKTAEILEFLGKNVYDIQQKLNKRLKMRPVPKIVFEQEEKTKEAGRIEELLEKIKDY